MKIADAASGTLDYRLNILGVRVWEQSCQLIAKSAQGWETLGPRWNLPVQVPRDAAELKAAGADTLRLTAYQYHVERTGSDIVEVLGKTKDFAAALRDCRKAAEEVA